MLIPVRHVREFAIYFYKLKCHQLAWDLQHKSPRQLPPYQWEKKGASIYTPTNIAKYQSLRRSRFRLLNQIKQVGRYMFYTGEHTTAAPDTHDSTETFKRQLLRSIRKIDRFCAQEGSTFMVLLDEQHTGNEWCERNVEACMLAMFKDESKKYRALIEPPVQGESHLFQILQCADWIGGLIGRLMALAVAPEEFRNGGDCKKYLSSRVAAIAILCSDPDHQQRRLIPATAF